MALGLAVPRGSNTRVRAFVRSPLHLVIVSAAFLLIMQGLAWTGLPCGLRRSVNVSRQNRKKRNELLDTEGLDFFEDIPRYIPEAVGMDLTWGPPRRVVDDDAEKRRAERQAKLKEYLEEQKSP